MMNELTDASTSRFITINEPHLEGFRLHYNIAGEGPAVVMLHGGGPGASGWSNYHKNIGPFVEAGFQVILLDMPGFNQSDEIVPPIGRGHLNASAIKGLLDGLGIEKAHLVGNSMGGATALTFALDFPERLDRLVLMGPAMVGTSYFQPGPQEGIKLMYRLYREPTRENFDRMLEAFVYDPSALTTELRDRRWENIQSRPQHLKNFIAKPSAWNFSDRLGEIPHRTLVTWGRDDRFVPIDSAFKLLHHMPDAQLYVFPRCGHWAQWEHADDFNRISLSFLQA